MDIRYRDAEKRRLLAPFGSACDACGYNRSIRALHFHHLDSSEKNDWGGGRGRAAFAEIRAHPERFRVLCATCHIEVHEALDAKKRVYATCQKCGDDILTRPSLIASGRKRYCSTKCEHSHRTTMAQVHLRARAFKYVQKTETCWNWIGYTIKNSRGSRTGALMITALDSKHTLQTARSVVYELETGLTPPKRLFSSCGNSLCVNPGHCVIQSTLKKLD